VIQTRPPSPPPALNNNMTYIQPELAVNFLDLKRGHCCPADLDIHSDRFGVRVPASLHYLARHRGLAALGQQRKYSWGLKKGKRKDYCRDPEGVTMGCVDDCQR